ncbi:5-formyltetrahydrofolate cyclo-ligase [Albidovulum sp.]|uniref:5-formyltetrahydrofolate cyclo-ligase n=1 Tax=Albidovulum sp. TaxID=1872424 RepID=UPI001D9B25C6|nr:5-formyltetrahydrofolate cyclo-ligase [Paracoccaceae bacterium]HPE26678.1 5-formyltetrahydrofolate cyclo-ligase [Albidovulum sp.]MCB2119185.1 5-formyltetrahydrofolate cyclo-ligase [Paracoccaceae bacterium]MCB2122072.1 5-formyltetrahydrofolate cyclo-ligase [Paracoccaceae bacterium]MCB2131117.1 5-formyltetrahydrofolate cyclo-ligase [Paracoccaceae bacterium]
MTLAETKAAARAEAFARRKAAFAARSDADCARLSEVLAAHAGKVLAGYMPMRTEIDCLPAMAAHRGPVGVPVILAAGQPLRFRRWHPGATMVAGDFGALIPESGDWVEPAVLIVPLLAFDRRGYRLGYGGGFYDRTLEGLRAKGPVTAVGFAFAAQEVAEVPTEPTDQPLDLIVTEAGAFVPAR